MSTVDRAHRAGAVPTPRFVSDGSRSLLGIVSAFVLGFAFSVGYAVLTRYDVDTDSGRESVQLVNGLVTYILLLGTYQALTWWRFRAVDGTTLADWARATTPHTKAARRKAALLGVGGRSWSVSAAVVALLAVLGIVLLDRARTDPWIVGLSLLLVALAWTNVVVASAVAYLRANSDETGLAFPEEEPPTWTDLFYLSVQVSTTFSSSDVDITTRPMRRLVTSQSIVAFLFNTVIVALLVSSLLTIGE